MMNKNNNNNRQPPPGNAKTPQHHNEEVKNPSQGHHSGQSRVANTLNSGTSGTQKHLLNVPVMDSVNNDDSSS